MLYDPPDVLSVLSDIKCEFLRLELVVAGSILTIPRNTRLHYAHTLYLTFRLGNWGQEVRH